jgi:hypothetical protein
MGAVFGIILAVTGSLGFADTIERMDNNRTELWGMSFARALGNPLFGGGLTMNTRFQTQCGWLAKDAHSFHVTALLYGGLFGLLLLLLVIGLSVFHGVQYFSRSGNVTPLVLLFMCVIAGATNDSDLLVSPDRPWFYFWLPIGLIAATEIEGMSRHDPQTA